MKIAIVSEHASPLCVAGSVDAGGQNIYVANIAKQLTRLGHAVDVFTRRESVDVPRIRDCGNGMHVVHVNAGPPVPMPKESLLPHMGEFASNLARYCQRERDRGGGYSILHANFFMSGLAALAVRKALRVPMVTTFHALGRVRRLHQGASDGFPDERFVIEERLVRESDRVIAECDQDRDDIVALYDGDASRISIVPCGFDAAEFPQVGRAAARARLGMRPDAFTVLQLGRIVPRKGIDNVIRALACLRKRVAGDIRLYIVGGNSDEPDEAATPEIARLRGIAGEEGIGDLVTFVGRRDRPALHLYYQAADVFVTTPWYEPFGITPVEAMACARPVIGAAVGGIRTTVVDGVTGHLVPPRDPQAVADKLELFMQQPQVARAMGLAGRARAVESFTWQGVTRQLVAIYRQVLEARAMPDLRLVSPPPRVANAANDRSAMTAGRALRSRQRPRG